MSNSGTNAQPVRLAREDAREIWQAEKDFQLTEAFWRGVGLVLLLQLVVGTCQGRGRLALLAIGGEFLTLVALGAGCRALGRRLRRAWHQWLRGYARRQQRRRMQHGTHAPRPVGRALFLLVLAAGPLQGCADVYKGMARAVGCDPVAIEQGYCSLPKGSAKP